MSPARPKISTGGKYVSLFNGGLANHYHVFSGDQYLGRLDTCLKQIMASSSREYNNAFIYDTQAKGNDSRWWRADGIPRADNDVPKHLLAMASLVA